MICYVKLCYVMLCYVICILCHVIICYVALYCKKNFDQYRSNHTKLKCSTSIQRMYVYSSITLYSTVCCGVRTEYNEVRLSEFSHAGVGRARVPYYPLNEGDVEA